MRDKKEGIDSDSTNTSESNERNDIRDGKRRENENEKRAGAAKKPYKSKFRECFTDDSDITSTSEPEKLKADPDKLKAESDQRKALRGAKRREEERRKKAEVAKKHHEALFGISSRE